MATFVKVDDYTIRKSHVVEEVVEVNYSLDFLIEQRKQIVADKEAYVAARDKELVEVDQLLAEAAKLKLKNIPKDEGDNLG